MIPQDAWTIPAAESGMRLDRLLRRRYPWLPAGLLEDLFVRRKVLLSGKSVGKGAKSIAGAPICIHDVPEPLDLRLHPERKLPLHILHEESDFLALNKPAGMAVHPLRYGETGTLANALLARFPQLEHIGGDPLFPAILHRLDTQTSGLLLAARSERFYQAMRAAFAARHVRKVYHALVPPGATAGDSAAPLTHHTRTPCRMRPVSSGEVLQKRDVFPAETRWWPIAGNKQYTLLEVEIYSGVTHQIRCHLAAAGFPIIGDELYGSTVSAARHFLHSSGIEFRHPLTAAAIRLHCPLPSDWPKTRPD